MDFWESTNEKFKVVVQQYLTKKNIVLDLNVACHWIIDSGFTRFLDNISSEENFKGYVKRFDNIGSGQLGAIKTSIKLSLSPVSNEEIVHAKEVLKELQE